MAVCIKSACRAKDQEFMKAWIQQRLLTSTPKSLPLKRTVHLKCTKPSLISNSYCVYNSSVLNFSTANFHQLASNILIYDIAYFPNMTARFAKDDDKVPTWEKQWDGIKEVYANDRFQQEMSRLREKGVMKDIKMKIPEGIKGMGAPPKDD